MSAQRCRTPNVQRRTRGWALRWAWAVPPGLALSGCIVGPANPAATQPATAIEAQQADADFWFARPATAGAAHSAFGPLWAAARTIAHDYLFTIDRADYRHGLLTTEPMTSKQFWELWRRDVVDPGHLAESSLATERRTVHFVFVREPGGGFAVYPKVLIERYSLAERRVTTVWQYREALAGSRQSTRLTIGGEEIPNTYWYAVGRDEALERELAGKISQRVAR